jgi:hypothetical protein
MANEAPKEWVLAASIPFDGMKGRDLEECVYWLLDAMGAKDLEWRTGGTGGGAADGGRDLEAHFYTPGADGELEAQKWWIECKGRKRTVEPDEVKSAVNNTLAIAGLDYVVIATNTQFSNPTRDWVKDWQAKYPRPKVKLWDHSQLERYLSRHPEVVLRLFSESLSVQGRFQAMESRFWNKFEYVTPGGLAAIWKAREELDVSAMGIFAAVVNEFANGSIVHRPWAAILDSSGLVEVLHLGLINLGYVRMRAIKTGVEQTPILRAYAYFVLAALDALPADDVHRLIVDSITHGQVKETPEDVQEFLLVPIMDVLLSEIQDVCSSDCRRISIDRNLLTNGEDEVENYWLRLEAPSLEEPTERYILRLENFKAPCVVGFPVDEKVHCPLFLQEPTAKNTGELLAIVKSVAAFRKRQAADKRDHDRREKAARDAVKANQT